MTARRDRKGTKLGTPSGGWLPLSYRLALLALASACAFDPTGFTRPGGADASSTPDGAPGAADAAAGDPDARAIDAAPLPDAAWLTLTFRRGLGGYAGAHDAMIREVDPQTNYGDGTGVRWDAVSGASPSGVDVGLVRFDDIVGAEPGQIPPGATVQQATLVLAIWDPGVLPLGALHEAATDWREGTVTWDNFGAAAGVNPADLGAFVAELPMTSGPVAIDVTGSVASWVVDPAANRGWLLVPADGNGNGVEARASEYATAPDRPTLVVDVIAP